MKFDNLEDANAWVEKAEKELRAQRRDWFRVNAYLYAMGMHGYELAIKDINTLLGDRPREANAPYLEDNMPEDMYDGPKMRQHIRAHLDLQDRLKESFEQAKNRQGRPIEEFLAELEAECPADMGVVPPKNPEE